MRPPCKDEQAWRRTSACQIGKTRVLLDQGEASLLIRWRKFRQAGACTGEPTKMQLRVSPRASLSLFTLQAESCCIEEAKWRWRFDSACCARPTEPRCCSGLVGIAVYSRQTSGLVDSALHLNFLRFGRRPETPRLSRRVRCSSRADGTVEWEAVGGRYSSLMLLVNPHCIRSQRQPTSPRRRRGSDGRTGCDGGPELRSSLERGRRTSYCSERARQPGRIAACSRGAAAVLVIGRKVGKA